MTVHHQDLPGPIPSGFIWLPPCPPATVKPISVFEPVPGPSEHQGCLGVETGILSVYETVCGVLIILLGGRGVTMHSTVALRRHATVHGAMSGGV